MTFKALIICSFSFVFIAGCSDGAASIDTAQKKSDYIIKKKQQPSQPHKVIPPQEYSIDYGSAHSSMNLPIPVSAKDSANLDKPPREYFFNNSDKDFPWNTELHYKPLSYIRSSYDSSKINEREALLDIVAYSVSEIEVLDLAFPDNFELSVVPNVLKADAITVAKKDIIGDYDYDFSKSETAEFNLMNIDCPEVGQVGVLQAKNKLAQLLAIAESSDDDTPVLKIRYRSATQSSKPLAILTIKLGSIELSVNRSMVYSGLCFSYSQYNQDRLLASIQDYARLNKKGLWSQQDDLIAANKWAMPWEYRKKNKAK